MATAKKTTPKKKVAKKAAATRTPAKKAAAKKAPAVKKAPAAKAVEAKTTERYVYAVGRRKTAVAQVRLFPASKAEPTVVNGRDALAYFGMPGLVANALSALRAAGLEDAFRVSLLVRGGGLHGQSDAAKLAVARALVKHDALLRSILKSQGLLTRDARSVERKKPGLKKARRAPQWSKR